MEAGDAPDTVTEALVELEADGYTGDFRISASGVRCSVCGKTHAVETIIVDRVYRFEGPSDPADEAIVLGVRCGECGAKGNIVSGYGPTAEPEVFEGLTTLASRG